MREVDGMLEFTGRLTPEHGAPFKTVIEALVSAEMRATRDAQRDGTADPDVPRRSVVQMQADALGAALRTRARLFGPTPTCRCTGATVVVRIDHDDLDERHRVRDDRRDHDPASRSPPPGGWPPAAQIISCVLGGDSQILDWGRTKRLFTPMQRLALVERDGGCAMCGAPPGHTKVHHIRWWATRRRTHRSVERHPALRIAVTTASTTTGGTSASTASASGRRCGSSRHPTSTPPALPDSADARRYDYAA